MWNDDDVRPKREGYEYVGRQGHSNSSTLDENGVVIEYIRDHDTSNNN